MKFIKNKLKFIKHLLNKLIILFNELSKNNFHYN